jgi:hypothetical protein
MVPFFARYSVFIYMLPLRIHAYIPRIHIYILLSLSGPLPRHPLMFDPPSISMATPVMCAAPRLARNSTSPAKSSGVPIRPVGCPRTSSSACVSRPYDVMRLGKTPGQMALTVTCSGASFDAVTLVRWMRAAFDGPSACGLVKQTGGPSKKEDREKTHN